MRPSRSALWPLSAALLLSRHRFQKPVEDAAIVEVRGLHDPPAAKDLVDGEQFDSRQSLPFRFRHPLRFRRAIMMLRRQPLAGFGVQIVQVRLGYGRAAGSVSFSNEPNSRFNAYPHAAR